MAKDAGLDPRTAKRLLILQEIEKFDYPMYEQRLSRIAKSLQISRQNLNHYIRGFENGGLVVKTHAGAFSIYKLTAKGRAVKEKLAQSERGVKTATWRYHNLILGYPVRRWGSWKFNPGKMSRMVNWGYQIEKAENGLQAHVQDTGLLKIYGPHLYGGDGEQLRIKATSMIQEAARWFIDRYGLELGEMKVVRKGQKELLKSEQLAMLVGRVKTDGVFVDASGGDENLEEPDDSFKVEDMLDTFTETPKRMDRLESSMGKLAPTMEALAKQNADLAENIRLHMETMNNINQGIRELRSSVRELHKTRDAHPSGSGERPEYGHFEGRSGEETGLGTFTGPSEPENAEIMITAETPKFRYPYRGASRIVGPFYPGARIWLPGDVADQLIRDGYARRTRGPRGG